MYRFDLIGVGQVSSMLYGNFTRCVVWFVIATIHTRKHGLMRPSYRFVNSRCVNVNVTPVRRMVCRCSTKKNLSSLDSKCAKWRLAEDILDHSCVPGPQISRLTYKQYGRRIVMMFEAARDIAAGEELFICYGQDYFESSGIWCSCEDFAGNHVPGPGGIPGTVIPEVTSRSRGPEPAPTDNPDDDDFYAVPVGPQGGTDPSGAPIATINPPQSGRNNWTAGPATARDGGVTTTPEQSCATLPTPQSSPENIRTRATTRRDTGDPTSTDGNNVATRVNADPAADGDEHIQIDVKYRGRIIEHREVRIRAAGEGTMEPVHVNIDVYLQKPGESSANAVTTISGGGDSRGPAGRPPRRAPPSVPGRRPGPRGAIRTLASTTDSPGPTTRAGSRPGLEGSLRISASSVTPGNGLSTLVGSLAGLEGRLRISASSGTLATDEGPGALA